VSININYDTVSVGYSDPIDGVVETTSPSSNWTLVSAADSLSAGDPVTLIDFNTNPHDAIYLGTYFDGTTYSPLVSWDTGDGIQYVLLGTSTGTYTYTTASYACYLRGTRILTAHGEVAIEDLQPGTLVVTRFGGLRPVKWIGIQSFYPIFLGRNNAPVRLRAGAIAPGVPHRDLLVSPDHSVVVGDHLVHARLLVNGITITQDVPEGQVDYLHIDLGVHDCVRAEGAWSESYAEQDNRGTFHNAAGFAAAFPEHQRVFQTMCMEQATRSHPALPKLRATVAAQIPPERLADDHDLHVMADGVRIDATPVSPREWRFDIPAGAASLRLRSRASVPAVLGLSNDDRCLGFCVTGLTVQTATSDVTLRPGSPLLGEEFFPVASNPGNWTRGDTALPAALAGDGNGPMALTVRGFGLPRYVRSAPVAACTAAPRSVPLSLAS